MKHIKTGKNNGKPKRGESERNKRRKDKNSKGATPSVSFAIQEVDDYKKRWYDLKNKVESILSMPILKNDSIDNDTLKVVLRLMEIIQYGYANPTDYDAPRYFSPEEDLDITHDEIASTFNRERR